MNLRSMMAQTGALFRFSLRNRYRNTWAGILWVFLQPLLQFGIQAFAFKYVVHIEHHNYLLFLLSGLLPWIFFTSTLEMNVGSFINHSFLFKSIAVSPLSFVFSQALDNALVLVLGLSLTSVALGFLNLSELWRVLFFIPASLALFVMTTSVSILCATYQVFFRDLRFVLGFVINGLYFLTPILYPFELIPDSARRFFLFNPLHWMLEPFRQAAFGDVSQFFQSWLKAVVLALIFMGLAVGVWRSKQNEVVMHV